MHCDFWAFLVSFFCLTQKDSEKQVLSKSFFLQRSSLFSIKKLDKSDRIYVSSDSFIARLFQIRVCVGPSLFSCMKSVFSMNFLHYILRWLSVWVGCMTLKFFRCFKRYRVSLPTAYSSRVVLLSSWRCFWAISW